MLNKFSQNKLRQEDMDVPTNQSYSPPERKPQILNHYDIDLILG